MRKSLNRNLESKSTDVMKQGIIMNKHGQKQMKQYFLVNFVVEKLTFWGLG